MLFCIVCLTVPRSQQHSHAGPGEAVAVTRAPGPAILPNESRLPRTVEVTIVAEPVRLTIVPGTTSAAYAYNGRVPGPMLQAYEGDKVIVHFINKLPEPSTIHWHGLHIPNKSDGSPYYPIAPGKSYDYVFTLSERKRQGRTGITRIPITRRAGRLERDFSDRSSFDAA